MERNEISIHELKVYLALKADSSRWITSKDVAERIPGSSPRTVRAHLLKLVRMGLVDQAEVFPAHRYRLSSKADKRNGSYVTRLHTAAEVFDIPLPG